MAKYFVAILLVIFGVTTPCQAGSGIASYYWQGQKTATGARYNPHGMTAAHRTLPFGTKLRVNYKGRSVTVTINDRGPFIRGRVLDLSLGAAKAVGLTARGIGHVTYAVAGE
jgi:rare lipoprotein A